MPFRLPVSSSFIRRARPRRKGRPSASGRTLRLVRRPAAPRFWHNIAPHLRALPSRPSQSAPDRERLWRLVLEARGIPFRFFDKKHLISLYVPPVATLVALHEIAAFEREKPLPLPPSPAQRTGACWFAALIALLIPWHYLRWTHDAALPFLPASGTQWLTAAGLDAYKVAVTHELWRTVTALTLHADTAHLVANLVMGCLFGIPLCRYTGVGLGAFLTLFAGAVGNTVTAYLRPASAMSLGFSTAVFAAVGLLAACAAVPAARHAAAQAKGQEQDLGVARNALAAGLPPLAAGLGLLALLGGSEAPGVDYLAHSMGLVAGLGTGLGVCLAFPGLETLRGKADVLVQTAAALLATVIILLSWRLALG